MKLKWVETEYLWNNFQIYMNHTFRFSEEKIMKSLRNLSYMTKFSNSGKKPMEN